MFSSEWVETNESVSPTMVRHILHWKTSGPSGSLSSACSSASNCSLSSTPGDPPSSIMSVCTLANHNTHSSSLEIMAQHSPYQNLVWLTGALQLLIQAHLTHTQYIYMYFWTGIETCRYTHVKSFKRQYVLTGVSRVFFQWKVRYFVFFWHIARGSIDLAQVYKVPQALFVGNDLKGPCDSSNESLYPKYGGYARSAFATNA